MAIQKLLHVKLRPVCFPKLQELLYAGLCFAWMELFPRCYNKTKLCCNTSAQNGYCHTMKIPITCDILCSLTHECPDDFFSEICFFTVGRWKPEIQVNMLPFFSGYLFTSTIKIIHRPKKNEVLE